MTHAHWWNQRTDIREKGKTLILGPSEATNDILEYILPDVYLYLYYILIL